jgi:hypothetical protein
MGVVVEAAAVEVDVVEVEVVDVVEDKKSIK